jgi:hypothetical protein
MQILRGAAGSEERTERILVREYAPQGTVADRGI